MPADRITLVSEAPEAAREPADRWPVGSVLALVLTGSLLGAAQACAELVVEKAPKRALSYTSYGSTTSSMVAVSEVARARLDLDSAWLHAFQAAAYIDAVGAGAARDPIEEARLRGQCGYLTELLRRGVDTLINVAGAGSFASASPLQRYWRGPLRRKPPRLPQPRTWRSRPTVGASSASSLYSRSSDVSVRTPPGASARARAMNPAYLSAFAALAGSLIGGLTTILSTWLTQHAQSRAQHVAQDLSTRQELYKNFIEEASRLYADAFERATRTSRTS